MVVARLDELGRGAWIALVVVGFWLWWPVGLAMLGYLAFGRYRQGSAGGPGHWYNAAEGDAGRPERAGTGWRSGWGGGWGCRSGQGHTAAPSGNRAFDGYRRETLQRLEEEQREFFEYLERLRQARDKSEFDAFMAERRDRPMAPSPGSVN